MNMIDREPMTAVAKQRIATYWQERAPVFDHNASHQTHSAAWNRALAQAVADLPSGARVIDLGAGTGACALAMARLGHEVTAVDIASGMLAELERHAEAEGLAVATLCADVETLAMAPASFDLVTMRNLLWTLPDPDHVLHFARGILRPGGRLLVADGYWDHVVDQIESDAHWSGTRFVELYRPITDQLPLYRGVSTAEIERLLLAAGFTNIRHFAQDFAASPYEDVTEDFFLLTALA
jgi:SAM-dependent methyltransferase